MFDELNPSQAEAVRTTEGPLLVLAGAGSGKTRVITHRIAHLMSLGVPADGIVALSFTNKAAGEMRDRMAAMVGPAEAKALVLGTFHSLGARMMRGQPAMFGLPSARFSILDQGDVFGMIRGLLRETGHHSAGDRRFDIGAIVQRVSLWKNEFMRVADVESLVSDNEYDVAAAKVYGAYAERLEALGAVDFDDLVCRIASVLTHDEEARESWRLHFQYLMVDEYQDTNTAQFEMLRQLTGPHDNLCVVGDDDQAIYGWRGAKVSNILDFDRHFPRAKVIKLEHNYRSRPSILTCANAVIRHNRLRHDKQLRATKGPSTLVQLVVTPDGGQESRWVGRRIRAAIVEEDVRANEIAVLYRSALQAKAIEEELQMHGIAYRVLGGQALFDKKEVKDVLAYLKVLVMPRDELAVRRALETPSRGIGPKTMALLAAHARAHKITLLDAVHRAPELPDLNAPTRQALSNFSAIVQSAREQLQRGLGTAAALRHVIHEVDLRDNVRKETGSDAATDARWGSVERLFGSVERFEERARSRSGGARWHEYLGNMSIDPNAGADAAEQAPQGKVTLATLHSAKGLEWHDVFLIGCEDGTLPHRRVDAQRISDAISGDVEEERRLFYVGITRARERLWLTRADKRTERGREIQVVPSRFLHELPPEGYETYDVGAREQLSDDAIDRMAEQFLSRWNVEESS